MDSGNAEEARNAEKIFLLIDLDTKTESGYAK